MAKPKTNHIAAVLAATHAALGTTAPAGQAPAAPPAKPSRLAGFASKPRPAAKPAARTKARPGATTDAVSQLAKGDW
jgi:hypothetical protein